MSAASFAAKAAAVRLTPEERQRMIAHGLILSGAPRAEPVRYKRCRTLTPEQIDWAMAAHESRVATVKEIAASFDVSVSYLSRQIHLRKQHSPAASGVRVQQTPQQQQPASDASIRRVDSTSPQTPAGAGLGYAGSGTLSVRDPEDNSVGD